MAFFQLRELTIEERGERGFCLLVDGAADAEGGPPAWMQRQAAIWNPDGDNPRLQLTAPLGVDAVLALLRLLDQWRAEHGLPPCAAPQE